MKDLLVYRKKEEPFIFRIIENPTNDWIDVRVHELTINNLQVSIDCIAKDDDMLFGGKGRSVYAKTRLWLRDWNEITKVEVFKECLTCLGKDCAKSCKNVSAILNAI